MTTHPINPPPAAGEGSMSEILELTGVAEQLAEESGFWRSCSGCHECNEGVPMGDFSNVFKCHLGGGCRECGGIGAVWDNTDYSDFADFCQQLDGRQPIDTDIPEAILSKAREIYEGAWPDPVRAIAEALMEASMPETINIETSPEGVTLSQDCQSPEWSITGKGGRTDMIFIPRDQVPALIKALQPIANEIQEIASW
jgi:hypothetical protein